MATIEALKTARDAARATIDAAEKAGDTAAELAAVDTLDAAEAALLDAQKLDRRLRGKRMERKAGADAGGKYQVELYDLGSALPQLDPDTMPGKGVVVFRSPELDVRRAHEAITGDATSEPAAVAAATITLIVACTVAPTFELGDPAALAYRPWWETVGRGVVNLAALHIGKLGGFQLATFQRVSK